MGKESKTARASAVKTVGEKHVISDEQYIKNLRNDLASAIYVNQEGARALLKAYDEALVTIGKLQNDVQSLQAQLGSEV